VTRSTTGPLTQHRVPVSTAPLRVSFYLFFPGGGIARYTDALLRALVARGDVAAELMCSPAFAPDSPPPYSIWPGLSELSHPIPMVRRARFLAAQFTSPLRGIARARAVDADILHVCNINHLTFPMWRRRLGRGRARVVATVHDVRRQKKMLSRRWERRQLEAFYRFADALFVHSECQLQELVEFAGLDADKVHVVPHGLYHHGSSAGLDRTEARRRFGLPRAGQIALFFGQLRDEKNLESLLRALASMRDPPHLVVAGRAGAKHHGADYYRHVATSAGVGSRVTFLDRFIADDEVAPLFAAADWVALPYREDFTSQSGVLNVAASYERPVLVSSAPVLRETVSSCDVGVTCDGDGPESLVTGITSIMTRVERGDAFAFAEYRRRFSWTEAARRAAEVYAVNARLDDAAQRRTRDSRGGRS